nr:MAG TPA: hypothetical protein [Caudoviricetes sp.]
MYLRKGRKPRQGQTTNSQGRFSGFRRFPKFRLRKHCFPFRPFFVSGCTSLHARKSEGVEVSASPPATNVSPERPPCFERD